MNETTLAVCILCASIFLTLVDPSKSFVLEYAIISLIGYLCGRTRERYRKRIDKGGNLNNADTTES